MIEVKPVQVSEVKTETTIDLNCFKTLFSSFLYPGGIRIWNRVYKIFYPDLIYVYSDP